MAAVFLVVQALLAGLFLARAARGRRDATGPAPRAKASRTAPGASRLLAFHSVGVGLVSLGIAQAMVAARARLPVTPRTIIGTVLVLSATVLGTWALTVFKSWRLLAQVDVGHALCTSGPYRFVRHPIYVGMDLWALGTALACPGVATIIGAAIIFVGTDLRSRAEERLMLDVFEDEYRSYMDRTRRLLPGIY